MSAPLLYLASKSPRRQALLRQLGIEFETLLLREAIGRERDVVEQVRTASPRCTTSSGSRERRRRSAGSGCRTASSPKRPVLGADTEVVLDGEVFGKPRDAADAVRMLRRCRGARIRC